MSVCDWVWKVRIKKDGSRFMVYVAAGIWRSHCALFWNTPHFMEFCTFPLQDGNTYSSCVLPYQKVKKIRIRMICLGLSSHFWLQNERIKSCQHNCFVSRIYFCSKFNHKGSSSGYILAWRWKRGYIQLHYSR